MVPIVDLLGFSLSWYCKLCAINWEMYCTLNLVIFVSIVCFYFLKGGGRGGGGGFISNMKN